MGRGFHKGDKKNYDNIHYVVGNAHDMAFLENILKEKYDSILDFMVYKPEEFRDRHIKFLDNSQ